MRIIAGRLGGRTFTSPGSERTHPMSDKIRGALFNSLGDIEDLTVLDAFTGSGALSFEALSRGASHVTAIDIDANALNSVIKNSQKLGIGQELKTICASSASWLQTIALDTSFDIVLCDPPYDEPQLELIAKLALLVKASGLLVISLPPDLNPILPADCELALSKAYGDARLYFYRRAVK